MLMSNSQLLPQSMYYELSKNCDFEQILKSKDKVQGLLLLHRTSLVGILWLISLK